MCSSKFVSEYNMISSEAGVWIQWNGMADWNAGMEQWNGMVE